MTNEFQEFIDRWTKKAEELKKQRLSRKACMVLLEGFLKEYLYFKATCKNKVNLFEREKIATDVKHAIMIANNNYDTYMREKSWWYRFFSGKKEFNLFKYK